MKTCRRLVGELVDLVVVPVVAVALVARLLVGDIFSDAWDAFSGGLSDIWNQIRSLIVGMFRQLIGFVLGVVQTVNTFLVGLVNWVAAVAYGLFLSAWNALNHWVGVLWSLILDARNFAWSLIQQTVGWVSSLVGQLYGLIVDAFNAISAAVDNLVRWVIDNVWNPLAHLVSDLVHFVTVEIPSWVNGIINNVWCFIKDVAQSIAGIAEGVVGAVLDPFMTLLRAGLLALKWIVWMALHPFDWFTTLLSDFLTHGSKWLVQELAHAIESNADTVDGWLARFFE